MWIVIEKEDENEEIACRIIPSNGHYEDPWNLAFGPDTHPNCVEYVENNCDYLCDEE